MDEAYTATATADYIFPQLNCRFGRLPDSQLFWKNQQLLELNTATDGSGRYSITLRLTSDLLERRRKMTPIFPAGEKIPELSDYRLPVRDALIEYYRPSHASMGIEHTLNRVFGEHKAQTIYESLILDRRPQQDLFQGCFPVIFIRDRWYPEPIEYQRLRCLFSKIYELFEEDDHKKIVIRVCRQCKCDQKWIDENLDDVIANTAMHLITPHLRTKPILTVTSDYRCFLPEWKNAYSSPLETRNRHHDLIHKTSHNTLRRMLRRSRHERNGFEQGVLEKIAILGRQSGNTDSGSLRRTVHEFGYLADRELDAIVLRLQGNTYAEIGSAMGISMVEARNLVLGALRKLGGQF
jgi:DNA-binding CsgD family transcriptional regulator